MASIAVRGAGARPLLLAVGMVRPAWPPPCRRRVRRRSRTWPLGAALAIGLGAIGAGIAVGIAGAAAIGAMAEKPELLGRTLIIVGLAEGIAIYGLIISFMILTR